MSDDNINVSPVYEHLPYNSYFAAALATYRQNLICALNSCCENFVIRRDESIPEFMATLRLINFMSSQLNQVNKFIPDYCPSESEKESEE